MRKTYKLILTFTIFRLRGQKKETNSNNIRGIDDIELPKPSRPPTEESKPSKAEGNYALSNF